MDRKGSKFLLSPTHEEEITSLVASVVISYRELPLRLYQISSLQPNPPISKANFLARKYRDEPRPRQGLLRTREFLMKDLYTFDATQTEASQTYKRVRESYDAFFKEFKLPFLTAEAASGEMGGDVSHEYHMKTSKGEDDLVICKSCNYAANEELAQSRPMLSISDRLNGDESTRRVTSYMLSPSNDFRTQINHDSLQWVGISRDCDTLVQAFIPEEIEISAGGEKHIRKTRFNFHAIKRRFPDINLGVEDPVATFEKHRQLKQQLGNLSAEISSKPQLIRLFDIRCSNIPAANEVVSIGGLEVPFLSAPGITLDQLDLVKIEAGDPCPKCPDGTLTIESAVELGHTFLLGTRYSTPLEATVKTTNAPHGVPIQMGCHGIGISRLIAAVADVLADGKGLNWPRVIAPYEAVVVPTEGNEDGAVEVYDVLTATGDPTVDEAIDTLLDDRDRRLGWKLHDADMIGYPIVIVVGKHWAHARRNCEVQCRRLNLKHVVPLEELRSFVQTQLRKL